MRDNSEYGPEILRQNWPDRVCSNIQAFFDTAAAAEALGCKSLEIEGLIDGGWTLLSHCTSKGEPLWPASELSSLKKSLARKRRKDMGLNPFMGSGK
jgi:hypothetical protein